MEEALGQINVFLTLCVCALTLLDGLLLLN